MSTPLRLGVLLFTLCLMLLGVWYTFRSRVGFAQFNSVLVTKLSKGMGSQSFICPDGENLCFIIGVVSNATTPVLHGTLRLSSDEDGSLIVKKRIQDVTKCNWLDGRDLLAYLPIYEKADRSWDSVLVPGTTYQIEIALTSNPADASLWLCYTTVRGRRSVHPESAD